MPHSSGGGSSGGGSFGGSSSGGGGGSGGNARRTSNTYFPGSHRYIYTDDNGVEQTIYSTYDVSKKPSPFRYLILLFYLPFIFALVNMTSFFSGPKKLEGSYPTEIVIEDTAGVLGDSAELRAAMENFRDTTGIPPAIKTVSKAEMYAAVGAPESRSDKDVINDYAYNQYLSLFSDESHWLFVYSVNTEDGNDWVWIGMQGDDTDKILTNAQVTNFNAALMNKLTNGRAVAQSFTEIFNERGPAFMENKGGNVPTLFILVFGGFIVLHASLFLKGLRQKYIPNARLDESESSSYLHYTKKAQDDRSEEPAAPVQAFKPLTQKAYCNHCGGDYDAGHDRYCPHCGAELGNTASQSWQDPEDKEYYNRMFGESFNKQAKRYEDDE